MCKVSSLRLDSKDAGFDPLIAHLKSKKLLAGRSRAVADIPVVKSLTEEELAPLFHRSSTAGHHLSRRRQGFVRVARWHQYVTTRGGKGSYVGRLGATISAAAGDRRRALHPFTACHLPTPHLKLRGPCFRAKGCSWRFRAHIGVPGAQSRKGPDSKGLFRFCRPVPAIKAAIRTGVGRHQGRPTGRNGE